ncbi:MAG TPA: acyltransferase [Devosia sp.]|nr:acyltransferase [Devosia sp.]
MNNSGRPVKLSALQGLRALAALMVVVDHTLLNLMERGLTWEGADTVAHRLGAAGVFIFFVVSGFIMAFTSEHGVGFKGVKRFLARRIWRIAPLYWLATAAYSARLIIGGTPPSAADIFRSLFFIPYFDEALLYHPILGPGWTLNFEMYFYLIFGASLLLRRNWALVVIATLFGGSIILGALMGWNSGQAGVFEKFFTDPIILFFVLGIVIHLVLARLGTMRMPGGWNTLVGLTALAALALIASPVAPDLGFSLGMYAVAPALVLVAVTSPPWGQGMLARLAVLLGDASYSLYLSHSFVVGPLTSMAIMLGAASAPLPFVAAVAVFCSIGGVGCYLLVEKSLLTLLRPIFVPPSIPKPARSTLHGAP